MKLHTLEIEGFGPFKTKQTVDFRKFDVEGLFLIEGPTGAGKSSVLDAITYVLYNFTPRWADNRANKEHKSVRSHFCEPADPTRVQLVFEVPNGDRTNTYRIVRSIPGLDKHGVERQEKVALFEVHDDGNEVGLASSKTTVAVEVERLLHLKGAEFLQVALLAQGKFQAFLEADNDQRLALLRKLFNTSRFQEIQKALSEKTFDLEQEVKSAKAQIDSEITILAQTLKTDPPTSGEESGWLKSQLSAAKEAKRRLEEESQKAAQLSEGAALRLQQAEAQIELNGLQAELSQIEARGTNMESEKKRLKLGQKAARVSGLFDALATSNQALAEAKDALTRVSVDPKIPRNFDALKPLIKTQSDLQRKLEPLVQEEHSLSGEQRELSEIEGEITQLESSLKAVRVEIDALKAERSLLSKNLSDVDVLRAAKQKTELTVTEYQAFEALRKELEEAKITKASAIEALAQALDNQLSIDQDYRLNLAASLAADLGPGSECMVCGSTAHPKKAKKPGRVITQEMLNAANALISRASSAEGAAQAECNRLEEAFRECAPVFKGMTLAKVEAAFQRADKAYKKAAESAARILAIDELLSIDGKLQQAAYQLQNDLTLQKADMTGKTKSVNKIKAKLENQLEGFGSVSERFSYVTDLLEQMTEVENVLQAISLSNQTRDKAEALFQSKLVLEGFSSRKAFEIALISTEELDLLEREIQYFTDNANRVKTLLSDKKFKGLPKSAIDVTEAQHQFDTSKAKKTDLDRQVGASENLVEQISMCQQRVSSLLPEIEEKFASANTHRTLANVLNGQKPNELLISLESYFAAAELEAILEAANVHLKRMSAGSQFTLKHSDKALRKSGQFGLGIEVLDEFTGQERETETMSGGEIFQVSLAIAFGLSQVVSDRSGAVRIDTLFIDEGFGTLDSDVQEAAMRTLDSLKQGGRTIGLISHVEKMQEEIASKLLVEKTFRGPSVIRHSE